MGMILCDCGKKTEDFTFLNTCNINSFMILYNSRDKNMQFRG